MYINTIYLSFYPQSLIPQSGRLRVSPLLTFHTFYLSCTVLHLPHIYRSLIYSLWSHKAGDWGIAPSAHLQILLGYGPWGARPLKTYLQARLTAHLSELHLPTETVTVPSHTLSARWKWMDVCQMGLILLQLIKLSCNSKSQLGTRAWLNSTWIHSSHSKSTQVRSRAQFLWRTQK
jgi:hypothetical protein